MGFSRQRLSSRRRRIIYNDDGDTRYMTGKKNEFLEQRFNQVPMRPFGLKQTQPDTMVGEQRMRSNFAVAPRASNMQINFGAGRQPNPAQCRIAAVNGNAGLQFVARKRVIGG